MNSWSESGWEENFGSAWVFLCLAFCAAVADEELTGFLPIYNATVLAMRSQYNWFPMPTFEFREWLTGLIVANIVLLLLTPLAFRNAQWLRPLAYVHAGVHLLNGTGHTSAPLFLPNLVSILLPGREWSRRFVRKSLPTYDQFHRSAEHTTERHSLTNL